MAQVTRSGSYEQNYNRTVLPLPWQKDNISHLSNHTNNIKKRKLETVKINANTSQNEESTSRVTTYNRFAILESTDDSMNVVETPTNQHTQEKPPPTGNLH